MFFARQKRRLLVCVFLSGVGCHAAWADPPKIGECSVAAEGELWLRDAAHTEAESGDGNQTPAPIGTGSPTTLKSGCGIKSRLLERIDDAAIVVKLANGKAQAFVPVYLSDKNKGFRCVAIRPVIACVQDQTADQNETKLALSTVPGRGGTTAKIVVRMQSDRFVVDHHPNFVLLPVARQIWRSDRYETKDLRVLIQQAAQDYACGSAGRQDCLAQRHFAAERRMMEFVRIDRRTRLPKANRTTDVADFLRRYSVRRGASALAHLAIVRNEIGVSTDPSAAYASPYEVLDAVLMKSGPSFGAHQVDVGNNAGPERQPFRDALGRLVAATPQNSVLQDIHVDRKFEKPGREYGTATLGAFHTAVPSLNAQLRTEEGRKAVDDTYDKYLEKGAGCFAWLRAMGTPFTSSRFAMTYVVDVANQSGLARAARLASLAKELMSQARSLGEVEKEMVADILKGKETRADKEDVATRVSKIRKVLSEWGDKAVDGGEISKCDIRSYCVSCLKSQDCDNKNKLACRNLATKD